MGDMRIFSANVDLEKAQTSRNITDRIRMHESPESSDMLSVAARECYPELGDLWYTALQTQGRGHR